MVNYVTINSFNEIDLSVDFIVSKKVYKFNVSYATRFIVEN